jgi:hypothetical protein
MSKGGNGSTPDSSHKDRVIDPPLIHDTCKTDPELAAVAEAWPELPEAIKAGILAMVEAARS